MIRQVFIEADVVLDVALARKPFVDASREVLAWAESGQIIACISSNSIANIYYILRKIGGDEKARNFITQILRYLMVIPTDSMAITKALPSKFSDFEDAIQHFTALHHQCEIIITRNIQDYQYAEIEVMQPTLFVSI